MDLEDDTSGSHSGREHEGEGEGEGQILVGITACGPEAVHGGVWPTGPPRHAKGSFLGTIMFAASR